MYLSCAGRQEQLCFKSAMVLTRLTATGREQDGDLGKN